METLEIAKLLISPFTNFIIIFIGLCALNAIMAQSSYGIKIKYLKKIRENKINPIYQLKYSNNMNGYVVKKYHLKWNKDYDSNETIYFLIPFLMLFFKYGYIEENGGYEYTAKLNNNHYEYLIGKGDIVEKDLEKFYEAKKLEAITKYIKIKL